MGYLDDFDKDDAALARHWKQKLDIVTLGEGRRRDDIITDLLARISSAFLDQASVPVELLDRVIDDLQACHCSDPTCSEWRQLKTEMIEMAKSDLRRAVLFRERWRHMLRRDDETDHLRPPEYRYSED